MPDPSAHSSRFQSNLDQVEISPYRNRSGRKIAPSGAYRVWRITEAETKPAAEPYLWRDWKLEPGGFGAEQDAFNDSPEPEVETGLTAEPHLWRDWDLEAWGVAVEQDGLDDYPGLVES